MGLGEVERLQKDYALELDWRPWLLHPGAPASGWPIPDYVRARMKSADNPLTLRANALGLTLVERELIPPTELAHQATEYARAKGRLEPFHRGLLDRYWTRGENLNDWAVLRAAAADAGLDADELQREVMGGKWWEPVHEALEAAREIGVTAVPTFIVGERYIIQGAQPGKVFRQVMDELGATPLRPPEA